MEDTTLKILQWNCKSIKENIDRRCELICLIYSQQPHIACISETWLTEDTNLPKINGYSTIRKDRTNRGGGGLLMLIRDDVVITHTQIDIPQACNIEAQAIEVKLLHEKVKLLHLYNPPPNAEINNFQHLTSQLGRKYIIVGDLNAHHTNWDPFIEENNTFGNLLSDHVTDNITMAVATIPGLPTYTNRSGKTSTLDLTICSNNILHSIETHSLADYGSDHRPVLTTVNLIPEN